MTEGGADAPSRVERNEFRVVVAVAVAVAVLALVRGMFSVGLTDDALYVALPMRLAEGGRIFVNEMSLQSLGYWMVIPVVKAWKTIFGMTGIVLAVRTFYVLVAGLVGVVTYRALRPSFSPAACALAATVPLLAAPYNILSLDYNTSVGLSVMLATALMFATIRDRTMPTAVAAGLAVGYAVISYPPLFPGAIVLLVAFGILVRDRRLAMAAVGSALALTAVTAALLVAFSSLEDIARTLAYLPKNVSLADTPVAKLRYIAHWTFVSSVGDPWLIPLWILTAVASIQRIPRRVRTFALLLLPAAAALSGIMRFVNQQNTRWFDSAAPGYLMIFLTAAAIPMIVDAIFTRGDKRREDTRLLLWLTVPFALAGYLLVTYATSAGWWRGTPVIIMTPLALAVVTAWVEEIRRGLGHVGVAVASLCLLLGVFGFLFGTSHDDRPPYDLHVMVTSGPYAGILTNPTRAAQLDGFQRAVQRWVKPGDKVFVGYVPIAYLFAPGPMATNQVWFVPGATDRETVAYFNRTGDIPDVAFIRRTIQYPKSRAADPVIAYLRRDYRQVDDIGNIVSVWVRRLDPAP